MPGMMEDGTMMSKKLGTVAVAVVGTCCLHAGRSVIE